MHGGNSLALGCFVTVVASLATFRDTVNHGFVWDDRAAILGNPVLEPNG